MPRRTASLAAASTIALVALLIAPRTQAIVLNEDEIEETSTIIGVNLRMFSLLFMGDVLEPPYNFSDQNPMGTGLFDARLYFSHRTPTFKIVAHNQFSLRMQTHVSPSLLPLGRGLSPPRWLPLSFKDGEDNPTLSLNSDVEWLYAAYTAGPVTITLGRQPVTFGRGTLWRTADRVSSFSLTEIDTEYKPGSDVLRVDISASEKTSVSMLAALGELESEEHDAEVSLRGSSFLARLKQGWKGGEVGLTSGFVRYDVMASADVVLDFGDLDLYGELTATWTTDESLATPNHDSQEVPIMSALVGATFRPVSKLTLKPEAHFNGFGSFEAKDYLATALSERAKMGEQTGLGKVYLGLSSDFEMHPLTHLVTATIVNVPDPSALLSLGIQHSLGDNVDLVAGSYLPMGRRPDTKAMAARSEYGTFPYFFFAELKGAI